MKYLISVFALLCCACGADVMPQLGSALSSGRDFYIAADRAQTQVTEVVALVCAEPPPAAVSACVDAIQALAVADQYNDKARGALIAAISVYNAVNGELLDDADAGAP